MAKSIPTIFESERQERAHKKPQGNSWFCAREGYFEILAVRSVRHEFVTHIQFHSISLSSNKFEQFETGHRPLIYGADNQAVVCAGNFDRARQFQKAHKPINVVNAKAT